MGRIRLYMGGSTLVAVPTTVKTGEVAPVILLRLDSPDLVRVFNAMYVDKIVNPKGNKCKHALFPYAVSRKKHTGPNKYGYVPHITLCKFPKGTPVETIAAGVDIKAMNNHVQRFPIEITMDDVVFTP